jgi:hypothetical protein
LIVSNRFHGHTVEPGIRPTKVYGKTRIPEGTYEIKLRTEGKMHSEYLEEYSWHRGMLWLQDVPNFEWIYIHILNFESQTDGCIGCGYTALSRNGFALGRSEAAYKDLCMKIYAVFDRGEQVHINIVDLD